MNARALVPDFELPAPGNPRFPIRPHPAPVRALRLHVTDDDCRGVAARAPSRASNFLVHHSVPT